MIRLVSLLRRQPDLSLAEFHERWRDDHGPRVAAHQTRLGILRYVQSHRLDELTNPKVEAVRGPMEIPYDGITEIWWESEEALTEARSSDAGRRALAELLTDEAEFVDLPSSPLWLAHEYPQYSRSVEPIVARPRSGIAKGHFPIRHLPTMTLAEAQCYWHTSHGPLVRSLAPARGMLAYQQVHRFETPLEDELRRSRGTTAEPYMGHAEFWFDRSVRRGGPEMADAAARAAEDEKRFIDFPRSTLWTSKEHVFIDRG